jgi:anti-anti-sigma factor
MNEGALLRTDRIQPDITAVILSGKLVMGRDPLELENLVAGLARQGQKKVILDLTRVYYIDSSGLGAIARCLSLLRREGGDLRLAGVSQKIQALFRTTRLDAVLAFYATVADASRDFPLPAAAGEQGGW